MTLVLIAQTVKRGCTSRNTLQPSTMGPDPTAFEYMVVLTRSLREQSSDPEMRSVQTGYGC